LVAFQTRNSPPAIRIRSRQEKACPNRLKTGAVSPTIHATEARSRRRMTSASPMPIRRACSRVSSGSLLDRIEMKMRLSMPSTTSIAMSVASAAHTAGSAKSVRR
jgi:hypothetical protein